MSHNLRRQAHQAEQGATHQKLDTDIADTKSLLKTSAKTIKDLKAQLEEITDKKKEAGKVPRNSQADVNKFNIPIPKIQGATATIGMLLRSWLNPPITRTLTWRCKKFHLTTKTVRCKKLCNSHLPMLHHLSTIPPPMTQSFKFPYFKFQ